MLPEVRFDTDTFTGLIEEARTMLAGVYPEWTNYNYSDPGITFLELFAWLKENQQFYMEQLGVTHYEQFFKLLGFKRRGRRPAQVTAKPRIPVALHIPAGTVFFAGDLAFETTVEESLMKEGLCRISHEGQEVPLPSPSGTIRFTPFGTSPCKGDFCTLFFTSPLEPGFLYHMNLRLVRELEILRNPLDGSGMVPLAKLSWSIYTENGWQELEGVEDETHGFLFSGRVGIRLSEAMVPLEETGEYAVRITLADSHYDFPPVLSDISMDGLILVQKRSWRGEPLLLADGNGFPSQAYELPWQKPVADSVKLLVENILKPGTFETWKRINDFAGCRPDEPVYMVDEADGILRFGDGYCGLPPEGRIYLTAIEETEGTAGNVKTGTVLIMGSEADAAFVHTEFEVTGELSKGLDGESLEAAILRAGTEKQQKLRAVTGADYEELVSQTPGLVIYSCKVLEKHSSDNEVSIVVRPGDGKRNLPLSPEYKKNIQNYLDPRRLIGTRIRLYAPEYIEVRVYLEVAVSPRFRQAGEMIQEAVKQWFSRLGSSFGTPVSYGSLYGMIDSMACVKRLRILNLEAGSASVRRSPGGDLIPPPNGVFLLKQVDYTSMND